MKRTKVQILPQRPILGSSQAGKALDFGSSISQVRVLPPQPIYYEELKIIKGGVVEMASRRSHKPKNTGSSPVSATNYGAVAQLGERLSCTQEVTSSTLVSSTIMFP